MKLPMTKPDALRHRTTMANNLECPRLIPPWMEITAHDLCRTLATPHLHLLVVLAWKKWHSPINPTMDIHQWLRRRALDILRCRNMDQARANTRVNMLLLSQPLP